MRGKIIHYNGNDGRGLIATDSRQWPFEIAQWRSDTAPAINQAVELGMKGDALDTVTRVSEEVLLKEKAGQLASRLGTAGGAAMQSLRDVAPTDGSSVPASLLARLGKPLMIAHAAFASSALLLPYITVHLPFGGSRSFTLIGLSDMSATMGAAVGGTTWTWIGILSIALPLLWRNRLAWLALLMPLFATVKPVIDIASAAGKAAQAMGSALGGEVSARVAQQLADMLQPGFGAWACGLSALIVAGIGLKRVLLPPP